MSWDTIAEGDWKTRPNIALDPNYTYRLTINTTINLPSWVAGNLQTGLGGLGLACTVTISGSQLVIVFGKGGGSGGGGGGAR